MKKTDALQEFTKMWTWLYRHPAHDKQYYVKHVAKPDTAWRNDCPLCDLTEDECSECLTLWDNGKGSLCSDPESPLSKWRNTQLEDPHFRVWYAGKIADIASKALKKSQ